MAEEPLLSAEQVAERLQISVFSAVKWMREGRIPGARKLGKFWRVSREDLEAFIHQPPALTLVAPEPEAIPPIPIEEED